jgi:hypothetical protein
MDFGFRLLVVMLEFLDLDSEAITSGLLPLISGRCVPGLILPWGTRSSHHTRKAPHDRE